MNDAVMNWKDKSEMLKLNDRLISQVVEQPESGMGYQIVKIKLVDNVVVDGIVFGSKNLMIEPRFAYPAFINTIDKIVVVPNV